ncbi:PREDICTED: LOW QUALITY PROTEIN: skin secretory protein xP2-like [Rhinopithecus bieti]|uniref:LOW QUALITY PROTEIN: skin secretory protein xP2-like n=1 Tax=Rhinopithecus bieti TaxID=61621 RepID=UPI00083BCA9F|nr:PREDICTED: LOW QUALITY PROTEIN: skin secretory protein xP2-like [Rhinopithecus bieti]
MTTREKEGDAMASREGGAEAVATREGGAEAMAAREEEWRPWPPEKEKRRLWPPEKEEQRPSPPEKAAPQRWRKGGARLQGESGHCLWPRPAHLQVWPCPSQTPVGLGSRVDGVKATPAPAMTGPQEETPQAAQLDALPGVLNQLRPRTSLPPHIQPPPHGEARIMSSLPPTAPAPSCPVHAVTASAHFCAAQSRGLEA